jgi:hypothetical protein
LDIDAAATLTYLDLSNNALAEPNVDSILLALVANNQTNGTVNLTGVANDAPSSTGLSAKDTLEARGWTVSVSTSSTINTKLLYFKGVSALTAKNALFINDYYFNNNVNIYRAWCLSEPVKTVYYVGAFGVGTTLYTDSGLTEFVIHDGSNWNYQLGVLVDATLNQSVPGDISIYQFQGTTGVILDNLGTIANSTYTVQSVERATSPSQYCDAPGWQDGLLAYYPPGQNGPVLGGYAHSDINCTFGTPGNNQLTPVFRQGSNATTLYLLDDSNTGLIVDTAPCTYVPTWNATWGATAQEAIDGTNAIAIKPLNGTSMLTCTSIKKADDTSFDGLPNPLYIAYDGVVRTFNNNGGTQAEWDSNTPIQPVTPPVTPYSFQLLQSSSCAQFNDPNNDPYKITAYSNFADVGKGTIIYTDAGLTTLLQQYTYYTNGLAYFNTFDYQWVYIYNPCYD